MNAAREAFVAGWQAKRFSNLPVEQCWSIYWRTALAAGSGTAETNEDLAQCEASQSGPQGNAQKASG